MTLDVEMSLFDMVGLTGVLLYVIAYTGVQLGQIDGNRIGYTVLNGLAAACVLFSMIESFNLAGTLVNALFLTFSIVGACRMLFCARRMRSAMSRHAGAHVVTLEHELRQRRRTHERARPVREAAFPDPAARL